MFMRQKLLITVTIGMLITLGLSTTTSAGIPPPQTDSLEGKWGIYADDGTQVTTGYFTGEISPPLFNIFSGKLYALTGAYVGEFIWYLRDDGTFRGWVFYPGIGSVAIYGRYYYIPFQSFEAEWYCMGVHGWLCSC
jgi:hypothetical protein